MRRSSEFAHGVQGRLMLIDVDLPLIARSVRLYPIPAVDLGWPVPATGPNSPTPRKKKKQVRVWWKQVLLVLHHCSNVSQAVQQDPCLSTLLLRVAFKLCYPVVILVKTWTQKSTKICILTENLFPNSPQKTRRLAEPFKKKAANARTGKSSLLCRALQLLQPSIA